MKDKELREVYFNNIIQVKHDIKELKRQIYNESVIQPVSGSDISSSICIKSTLAHRVMRIENQLNDLINNQKLIMEHLGIQIVHQPAMTFIQADGKNGKTK